MSDRVYHWRRYNELAVCEDKRDLVASACGHLVNYQEAVRDEDEATCEECNQIKHFLRSNIMCGGSS